MKALSTLASLAAAVATVALGAAAAPSAHAAETFGAKSLDKTPSISCLYECILHGALDADGNPITGSPIDGVLTRVSLRHRGSGGPTEIVILRPTVYDYHFQRVLDRPVEIPANTAAPATVHLPIRARVKAGDRVGIHVKNPEGNRFGATNKDGLCLGAAPHQKGTIREYDTDLGLPAGNPWPCELLLRATVEPDADNDGFGDETQDNCPYLSNAQTGPDGKQIDTDGDGEGDACDPVTPAQPGGGQGGGGDPAPQTPASPGGGSSSPGNGAGTNPGPGSGSTGPGAPPATLGRCANTLRGTRKPDVLTGTPAGDRIIGGFGSDRLRGLAGDDCLSGGWDKDRLQGGDGNDRLEGGAGNDVLEGGKGTNSISAGAGNDRIEARNGKRDFISCGSGRDRAFVDRRDVVAGCEAINGKKVS